MTTGKHAHEYKSGESPVALGVTDESATSRSASQSARRWDTLHVSPITPANAARWGRISEKLTEFGPIPQDCQCHTNDLAPAPQTHARPPRTNPTADDGRYAVHFVPSARAADRHGKRGRGLIWQHPRSLMVLLLLSRKPEPVGLRLISKRYQPVFAC
jgi:hypothetical protein